MSLPQSTSTVAGLFLPLAHQGGWDEVLLVVAPLALIGLLLYVANRRVNAKLQQAGETDTTDPTSESEDSPA